MRGGASGRKGLRKEGRGGAGEGGQNRDACGRPRGEKETGWRMTAREMMTAEEGCRRRGHNDQVSRNGDRGERCGARQGDRETDSEGLSGGSDKASDKETEEDSMPAR